MPNLMLDILTDCHSRLSGKGVQLDTFHSENNARDIVNVLLSLGYERWNLVGVSYGSRLALAMMRDYPQYIAQRYPGFGLSTASRYLSGLLL